MKRMTLAALAVLVAVGAVAAYGASARSSASTTLVVDNSFTIKTTNVQALHVSLPANPPMPVLVNIDGQTVTARPWLNRVGAYHLYLERRSGNWNAVLPLTTEEAKKTGRFAPWADHRTYMEISFAHSYQTVRDAVVEGDALGHIALSGTQVTTPWDGCDWSRLDRVIDLNFYPIAATRRSNLRWRPVGLGVMGLADVFFQLGLAFDEPAARALSKRIAEAREVLTVASDSATKIGFGDLAKHSDDLLSQLPEGDTA